MLRLHAWSSIIIFICSYSPLALILVIRDFDIKAKTFNSPILALTLICVVFFSIIYSVLLIKNIKPEFLIKVRRVSCRSNELVNYSLPYIVSLTGVKISDPIEFISFMLFFIIMFLLSVMTQSIFVNPIFALLGYGLYDVEFEENGIIKQSIFLTNVDLKVGNYLHISKITKFQYLAGK